MERVTELRHLLHTIDPKHVTGDDLRALLDFAERCLVASPSAQLVEQLAG
jgi:hypothetical protein